MSDSVENLERLATTANEAYARAQECFTRGTEHALAAGKALRKAKRLVGHGAWGQWLQKNFEGSERTAQLYMRIADRFHLLDDENRNAVAEMSLRDADRFFAEPMRIKVRVTELPAPVQRFRFRISEPEVFHSNFGAAADAFRGRPDLRVVSETPEAERTDPGRVAGIGRNDGEIEPRPGRATQSVRELVALARSRSPEAVVQEMAESSEITKGDRDYATSWFRRVADGLDRLD